MNPSQDIADAMFAKMDELADDMFRQLIRGDGTGEPRGILNMPGVATLVDDGVTRGPMGLLTARAITLEDIQAAYHQLPTPAYRPASLLPASVNHE